LNRRVEAADTQFGWWLEKMNLQRVAAIVSR
jgi:hypothetical protein